MSKGDCIVISKMSTANINASLFLTTLTFTICFISTFSMAQSRPPRPEPDIDWWCNQTPHPGPCDFFLRQARPKIELKHRTQFRKMAVQLALERALATETQVLELGPGCKNHLEKRVWDDCLKLHSSTIFQLNRTLEGLHSGSEMGFTDFDFQTWLSAALTNIRTCQMGSRDLSVPNFVTPIMSNNLSELISNSLAINGQLLAAEDNNTQGFPHWFTRHDRKILVQSNTILIASANLVVAKDGSGHFKRVQDAINAAANRKYGSRFIIYVKKGIYKENIEVGLNNNNIWLIGDGMKSTIITSALSVGGGYTTYSCATAGIDGLRFVARGITFRNTAGPQKGQAVALRSASDLSVYYRCSFQGYQDTLFVLSQRQFYRECYIYGTIDFIFGNAAVVFQKCNIYVRRPLMGQANIITAQGRYDPYQNTGISIHNCQILPTASLLRMAWAFKTYLGRPWMQYSRTVIMRSYIGGFISPEGWSAWDNSNFALDTLFYGEYRNFGPGSSTRYRVKWKGFRVIKSPTLASRFTVGSLLAGRLWLPTTGVPFNNGL